MVLVQAGLLFGSKTWVLDHQLEKSLEGFHHWAARRIEGMGPKRQRDGTLVYSPIGAALEMVGLEEIGVYTARRQNTVTQHIVTSPIIKLCLEAERKPVMHLSRRWWEQPALDILGIRAGHVAVEGEEEMGAEELEAEGEGE